MCIGIHQHYSNLFRILDFNAKRRSPTSLFRIREMKTAADTDSVFLFVFVTFETFFRAVVIEGF